MTIQHLHAGVDAAPGSAVAVPAEPGLRALVVAGIAA